MMSDMPVKAREHLLKNTIFLLPSQRNDPGFIDPPIRTISVAKFNKKEVIGQRRFLGCIRLMFTTSATAPFPGEKKTGEVLRRAGYGEQDYGRKELNQILAVPQG